MTHINALKLEEQMNATTGQHQFHLKAYHQETRLITWGEINDEVIHQNQEHSFLWIIHSKIQEISMNINDAVNTNTNTYTNIEADTLYNVLEPYIQHVISPSFLLIGLPQILIKKIQIPLLKNLYSHNKTADVLETGAACRMIKVLQEEQRDFCAILVP